MAAPMLDLSPSKPTIGLDRTTGADLVLDPVVVGGPKGDEGDPGPSGGPTPGTAPDEDGQVVVSDGAGVRWAQRPAFVNVREYGAHPTAAAADNTTAIQNALTDLAAGGTAFIPAGTYNVTSLAVTGGRTLVGADRTTTELRSATGDVLTLSGAHWAVSDLTLRSRPGGGRVLTIPPTVSLSQSAFQRVNLKQDNAGQHIVYYSRTDGGSGGGIFDVHWQDVLFQAPVGATVSAFSVYSNGGNPFSANRFTRCRAHNSATLPFFHIVVDKDASYAYANVWSSINFEVANGGGIRIDSAMNNRIDGVGFFDNGTIAGDLISLGRVTGTPARAQSRGNVVTGYHRSGGTLSGGAVDIHLRAGECAQTNTLVGITGPVGAGITVNLGAAAGHATVVGYDAAVTLQNVSATNTVLVSSTAGMSVPTIRQTATAGSLEVDGALDHDGATAGFYGAAPVARPSLTYSRTGESTAEAQLRAALASLGLVQDATTA